MQLQLIEILGKCRDCPIWVRSPLLLIILDWTLCEREILLRSIAFLKILLFPVLIFFFLQVYVLVHKTRYQQIIRKCFLAKLQRTGYAQDSLRLLLILEFTLFPYTQSAHEEHVWRPTSPIGRLRSEPVLPSSCP